MAGPTTFFFAGELGEFRNTEFTTVTAASQAYEPPGPFKRYCIFVDTDTHLALNRDATTEDFLLKAGGYVIVHIDLEQVENHIPGGVDAVPPSINWIEDSADGHIYITECGRH